MNMVIKCLLAADTGNCRTDPGAAGIFLCRKSADTDTENEGGSNHGTGLGISSVFCGF